CAPPEAKAVKVSPPDTGWGVGLWWLVLPVPSCPALSRPQQDSTPFGVAAAVGEAAASLDASVNGATVNSRSAEPAEPRLSVTVTATVWVPSVPEPNTPLISPVEVSSDSPSGSPVADQAYGGVPPEAVSVAR